MFSDQNMVIFVSKEISELDNCNFSSGEQIVLTGFSLLKIKEINITDLITGLKKINEYNLILFTSQNAVKIFFKYYLTEYQINQLPQIICVGSRTAEICRSFNFNNILIPDEQSASGVVKLITEKFPVNSGVFFPASILAADEMTDRLNQNNYIVKRIDLYDSVLPDDAEKTEIISSVNSANPSGYIFTSPSNFKNYLHIFNVDNPSDYFKNKVIAAIGKTTSSSIMKTGVTVNLTAETPDLNNLIKETYKLLSERSNN